MDGAIHLVVSPVTAELAGDRPPCVISCKVVRVNGTLIVFVDASSPSMSEAAMIDGMIERLRPAKGGGPSDNARIDARGNSAPKL